MLQSTRHSAVAQQVARRWSSFDPRWQIEKIAGRLKQLALHNSAVPHIKHT
jgi:hypothetical protein